MWGERGLSACWMAEEVMLSSVLGELVLCARAGKSGGDCDDCDVMSDVSRKLLLL